MGTQVHYKSCFPGYYSMRDLNEDSNSSSWSFFYGDKTLTSGQYYNGYVQRTVTDACPGYDKDALKQKMLEHEAVFKNQVYELHRLYRIQRDMMEDIRRKEIHKRQMSIEPSSSSSLLGSQMPSEDAGKWHMSTFPLANSGYPRPSVSGAEIVNSPLSCTKGNNVHAARVNGSTSKDCEILEVRPSKVRKKLFDLQLPADEYIDTEEGEHLHDNKVSNVPSSLPNGNKKAASENHEKFFHNGTVEKIDYQRDASTSGSCFRRSMKVADLNEPVQMEDGMVPSSVDFCVNSSNCGETKGLNLSAKPSSDFLGFPKEIMQTANRGNQSAPLSTTMSVSNKGNERDWLSGLHESDHRKNNLISLSQGLQQDHQSVQVTFNKAHQPPATLPNNYGRDDLWRDRAGHGVETLDRIHTKCNNNHLESVVTAQIPSPYPFTNSSDFVSSWSHSALSWAKPTSSMTEKLSSFHAYPSLNSCTTLSKSSQSSAQSHGILGEKWQINGSSRLNPSVSDLPVMNGFYQGSSSGSKEMLARYPSLSFSHLNCNGIDNAVYGRSLNHGPEDLLKGSNMDVKPVKDMDLNVVHSKSSSIEALSRQDIEIINETHEPEDHLAALPWLRSKPASKSEATNARKETELEGFGFFRPPSNQLRRESEHVKDLNKFTQKVIPASSDRENVAKETSESKGIKKILGFPIFEKPSTSRNESSLPASTSVTSHHPHSGEKLVTETRRRIIDINLACDEERDSEALTVEKVVDTKVAHIKNHIDLNSCVSEDEDPVATSVASNSTSAKIVVDIDLEAPVQEIEDDIPSGEELNPQEVSLQSPGPCEQTQDEVARMAAEAIILLSSSSQHTSTEENTCQSSEDPLAEILLWFADVLTSSDSHENKGGKELKGTDGLVIGNYSSDEMDDFEVMTLQLQETKEEDYLPKPFVPEVQNMEESGANSVTNRPRKGQTRRGRQRRDFQRDILPGLASLSRHEVTEDLQTFGGLMRATGQPWNSGLTRRNGTRNGGARGRRRTVVDTISIPPASVPCTPLMQQLNNIEAGLEDRSLTGWGKTTRRPRRQRCPAGNPPTVPLT